MHPNPREVKGAGPWADDRMDIISLVLGLMGWFALGYLAVSTVDTNPIIAQKAQFGVVLIAPCYVFALAMTSLQRSWTLQWFSARVAAITAAVGLGLVAVGLAIQAVVFSAVGSLTTETVLQSKAFYAGMGIGEDFLFAYIGLNIVQFLAGFLPAGKVYGPLLANAVISYFFMLYHNPVYGALGKAVTLLGVYPTYVNGALTAVFLTRFAWNIFYQYFKPYRYQQIGFLLMAHSAFNFFIS